jgi:TonB family protein
MALAGTVKLKLHILKNGSLDSAEVMESSGNDILDQDAVQAAETAAPYGVFTTGMDREGIIFTIPIVYNNLISGSAQAPAEKVIASY